MIRRFPALLQIFQKLRRDQSGTTAVEFAFVSVPFVIFLSAILEIAINGFFNQVLDDATQKSARLILTGKAHSAVMTQTEFKAKACSYIGSGMSCDALKVNVRAINASFYEATSGGYSNGTWTGDAKFGGINGEPIRYCPGGPGDYVVVQLVYPAFGLIPFMTPPGAIGGDYIATSAVIRNEPFTTASRPPTSGC